MQKTVERKLAEKLGITEKEADKIFNACIEAMRESIVEEQDMELRLADFGTFKVTERSARQGRNPQTGEAIQIPAKKVVKFKPYKWLKENLNPAN